MNINPGVLMVSTDMNGKGGVASVISTYIEGGLQENCNILFLVTHVEGGRYKKISSFISSLIKLPKYLVSRKYKIFRLHTASRASFLRKSFMSWLGIFFGKKVILHLHGAEFIQYYNEECGAFLKWYIKSTFNAVDRVVVLSSQWKENIQEIADSANIIVIFNPISISENKKSDSDKKILLFLGRIGKRKGFWDILNALSLIKESRTDFVLKYGGDGDIDKANDLIEKLDLGGNTEYLGWVSGEGKKKILNQSLIYLLPSYNEGLPIGILEAMAAKVAIVTSPVGGIPDAITDGVNGLLVPAGDVKALSLAIIKLLDSKSLREDLSDKAYDDAVNKFSVQVIVPQVENLYHELLSN